MHFLSVEINNDNLGFHINEGIFLEKTVKELENENLSETRCSNRVKSFTKRNIGSG